MEEVAAGVSSFADLVVKLWAKLGEFNLPQAASLRYSP